MLNKFFRKKEVTQEEIEEQEMLSFMDVVAPGAIQFLPTYYICGNSYRCVWSIKRYLSEQKKDAILREIGATPGVTLKIYHEAIADDVRRKAVERDMRKQSHKINNGSTDDILSAKSDIEVLSKALKQTHEQKIPLIAMTVFMELRATSLPELEAFKNDIRSILAVEKIVIDELTLQQEEGFKAVYVGGSLPLRNKFKRIMAASSAANMYPFNYSGKNDSNGFFIGKDKFGSNIIVNLDNRATDKTNGNVLIVGNQGEGKSYLMKLLLINNRELGKSIIAIDPENELEELCYNLGGTYLDFDNVVINPLQVKDWTVDSDEDLTLRGWKVPDGEASLSAVKKTVSPLSLHIAFLRDFFGSYKPFTSAQLDALGIIIEELYRNFGITDDNCFNVTKYPLLKDLYELVKSKHDNFEAIRSRTENTLFKSDLLQELALALHSICVGADSRYFNGETNIKDDKFIVFSFAHVLDTNKALVNALLFNTFSYIHHQLLNIGNTVAALDELHLFLDYPVALGYIRGDLKRVRKHDSLYLLATQNIDDFLLPGIKEMSKPMFAIPTHHFLFFPGNINRKEYIDTLNLQEQEFELIASPHRGSCLFRSGAERFLLQVKAPEHKAALFGTGGGR